MYQIFNYTVDLYFKFFFFLIQERNHENNLCLIDSNKTLKILKREDNRTKEKASLIMTVVRYKIHFMKCVSKSNKVKALSSIIIYSTERLIFKRKVNLVGKTIVESR